jgi:hypothetical protein
MKKIKYILVMFAVCAVAFSSCKKSNPKPTTPAQSISLKFNGTALTSSTVVAVYSKTQNAIVITGGFGSTSAVSLAIVSNVKVGSFDIGSGAASGIYTTGSNLADAFIGISGTVAVTAFTSTSISGTFVFTGMDLNSVTGAITSGTFTCNYTSQ